MLEETHSQCLCSEMAKELGVSFDQHMVKDSRKSRAGRKKFSKSRVFAYHEFGKEDEESKKLCVRGQVSNCPNKPIGKSSNVEILKQVIYMAMKFCLYKDISHVIDGYVIEMLDFYLIVNCMGGFTSPIKVNRWLDVALR